MKRHSLSIDVVQGKKTAREQNEEVFIYERKKIEKKTDRKNS